jgi:hypothetical protein
VVVSLAIAAALAARWEVKLPRWSWAACAIVMLVPFWALPGPGNVRNYPNLDEAELHQLGDWARTSTAIDAVFLFPEFERGLQPGFFRVYAKRSLWVDWKSGGQVNLLKQFAVEWWKRWSQVDPRFQPAHAERYASLGVDYLVLKAGTEMTGVPKYANSRYAVFSLR